MKYYKILVGSSKKVVDQVPSADTSSEVFGLFSPPSRITSPESSPQHRWYSLGSTRPTGRSSKFSPSNFSQDFPGVASHPPSPHPITGIPPQRKLLQKVDPTLLSLVRPFPNTWRRNGAGSYSSEAYTGPLEAWAPPAIRITEIILTRFQTTKKYIYSLLEVF